MSRRVSVEELNIIKGEYIDKYLPYTMCYWSEFNYDTLKQVVQTHKKLVAVIMAHITILSLCATQKQASVGKIQRTMK